jgi:hypothetical protein
MTRCGMTHSGGLRSRRGSTWSAWELIEKYGRLVGQALLQLTAAERFWERQDPDKDVFSKDAEIEERALATFTNAMLKDVRRLAILTDWDGLISQINRVEGRLRYSQTSEVAQDLRTLRERIEDELKSEHFFHLTPSDVPLYTSAEPFGPEVSRLFQTANEDIAEAAKCLALRRNTAAVFHLMRVMELAIRALAKRLRITTIDPEVEGWNKITDHVNKAINGLPAKTAKEQARKAKFGAASAHLNSVRIAWRNEVMHPKQSYTREEAHTIFAAVRAFMIDLAALK